MIRHHRTAFRRAPLTAAATAAVLLSGLAGGGLAFAAPTAPTGLQEQFAAAAKEFKVPAALLLAVSYQQTRWESHQGLPSTTGNYNVMGLTQVDLAEVAARAAAEPEVDLRGDGGPAGKRGVAAAPVSPVDSPALHTLDAAARLTGRPAAELRTDTLQSIRGGAALLADYQRAAGGKPSADPADWYQAVVRFSNGGVAAAAGGEGREFADRVYGTLGAGAARTTTEGQPVRLAADPAAEAKSPAVDRGVRTEAASRGAGRTGLAAADPIECPATAACDFQPAAYAAANGDYGNYTLADRTDQDVQYIVIHDTEGGYAGSLSVFQNPANQSSAHYLLRSNDGHITQMVADKNIAWHAGNKTVNQHSIGIEHEGYALSGASWYSEQLYQSSANLTAYLANKYHVPLDREHIIGHDEVPGPTQSAVAGMHWDPGTFWDWNHYMDLVGGRPAADRGYVVGGRVVISPPFSNAYRPTVNGAPLQPANFVYLYTAPNGPLIGNGTQNASDWTDKAVAGASYVVADIQGNWTAIWYDGRKAWFWNDGSIASADNRLGQYLVTPKSSTGSIPLYGRAYPEDSAYTGAGVPVPSPNISPLDAVLPAGQSYVMLSSTPVNQSNGNDYFVSNQVNGDTYYAPNLNDVAKTVSGFQRYFAIRYNHRLAYVSINDVRLVPAATNVFTSGERVQLLTQTNNGPMSAAANYTRGVWEKYRPTAFANPAPEPGTTETDSLTYVNGQPHAVALTGGHLYTADRNVATGVWSDWYDLQTTGAAGVLPSSATEATVVTMGSTMHVLALVDGRIVEAIADYSAGTWRPWADVSAVLGQPAGALTRITAAVNGSVLHIDGIGTDGRIHVADGDYARGRWGYGDVTGAVGVLDWPLANLTTVTSGSKQYLLALLTDGRILQATADYAVGSWVPWSSVTQATGGGVYLTKLGATYTGTTLRLFGVSGDGRVYNANGDYARGSWTGWMDIGVPGVAGNGYKAKSLAVAGTN
ncbi:N-acetylmuramoyl-L-alanine amidase [Kitasatospora sp. SolWspMP-SS2h]|uniref:N-acetylmuramoyl-L-alanine amidase n=1 Tax=Kitasatospora sp. SolWspMP-SS2h TaxID=1305729 RepID=UPI000DBABD51|nr:N-acetylmuramoyl-L-alanine amidase [Kitasatospora sp. SolWspMP-SS2h]RAJ37573.1 N-acetylmuramoyl-L-alanine amidase [Kitasatospora sp. SolWspMP-SS2h]